MASKLPRSMWRAIARVRRQHRRPAALADREGPPTRRQATQTALADLRRRGLVTGETGNVDHRGAEVW